jgi:hypothetical protein
MADNVIVRVPEQQFIRGEDGYSPVVTIENIDHGHSVAITDRDHPEGQSFNVLDGASAYEQAVAGGYTGTEAQFNDELASFKELSDEMKEVAPFYAEYGVTTKAEIEAAINNKRQIYLNRGGGLGGVVAPYTGTFLYADIWGEGTGYRFARTNGNWQYVYELKSEWTYSIYDLTAPAQRAETAAAQALTRMNSADASAQAAATTATTFTEQTVPAAVSTINEAKADALTAVGNAQTTAVGAVQQESTTQQAAIQQKGDDVLESIPSDYTELTEDVDNLKSAFNGNLVAKPFEKSITKGAYIRSDTGKTASDAKYARTALQLGYRQRVAVSLSDPNYEFRLAVYDETAQVIGTTGYHYSTQFSTGTQYVPQDCAKFGISFRRVDEANISDEDITAIMSALTFYSPTDTTLSIAFAAADAKATGEAIEATNQNVSQNTSDIDTLKSAVNAINPPTPTTVKKELDGFIQGSIRTSNGGNVSASNRLRSNGVESYNEFDEVTIEVPEGYTFSVREYSVRSGDASILSANYVGYFPDSMTGGPYTFAPVKGHYYRYVLGKSDNENFTPDDFDVAGFNILAHVANSGDAHPNTLLGNVSIRASKTYMFSDGTQPVTEWWLLQDVNNNFYSTRDFATKKFLFNFVAPSSIVSNWSCGIDAYDNVIFVKDAAGYIGKDGARLDDNKRVNPICFLASDNYSEPHIIDFGTAFKPAGWLENLGWCVLPNRDIIMCEYTRGTLATCNVWHINGTDITDPNNWTKTWSHAIIDTESPSENGMKHCHCVQYDFFTGICYFSTGDSEDGSYIYHSIDNGLTWALTFGPDKAKCRQLNFAFTADKVYWASDSYEAGNKLFAVAERNANGVIDVENATYITLPVVNNQACYGCVYLQALGLIVMLDRNDSGTVVPLTLKAYDIATQTIVTLGQIKPTGTDGHIGFRCKYVDWYPHSKFIRVGFNPRSASIAPDINVMAVCGNKGGYTAGGDGSDRINSLSMYIYKIGSNFTIQFDTVDC